MRAFLHLKEMTKSDQLQSYVHNIVKTRLEELTYLTELERLGFMVSIYSIFERNATVEESYYELLDYLEEQVELASLTTKVEMFYSTSFN